MVWSLIVFGEENKFEAAYLAFFFSLLLLPNS